jgi:hypothetical protein
VPSQTSIGLLHDLMLYNDLDKYFGLGRNFGAIHQVTVTFLESKYPSQKVKSWLEKLDIDVIPTPKLRATKKRKIQARSS